MQRIGTLKAKTRTRVFDEGAFRGFTEYLIESEPGGRPAPQAFLVHQQPGWTLPTHFHLEEQFQVVLGGTGTLGRHPLAPVTVHYTTREVGYGPLVAGPEGLDYLSLRAVTDPGAWYLPESRARMRRDLKKRHATVGPVTPLPGDELATLAAARLEALIEVDTEGLAAWRWLLPPDGAGQAPPQAHGGGRFHIVVAGSLQLPDGDAGPATCVWHDAGDAPLSVVAGSQGLELLVLQFPARALEPLPS